MKLRVWQRWLGVGALIVTLVMAAFFSFRIVQQNRDEAMYLADVDLPMFDRLMQWRAAMSRLESQLYSFYVTTDHAAFEKNYRPEMQRVETEMTAIAKQIPDAPVLRDLHEDLRRWRQLSDSFERVMTAEVIDWDGARQVLWEFSPLATRVGEHNLALTQWMRSRVTARSNATLQRTESMLLVAVFFTATALLAAFVLAWSNRRRLQALHEQRRLSSYPQRNPHAVIALSPQGELRYANPSAFALTQQLGLGDSARSLLPDAIHIAMQEVQQSSDGVKQMEYLLRDRSFHLMLHWLPDFDEFRIYLADISERKLAEDRLRDLAYHDPITHLPNRASFRAFFSELSQQSMMTNKLFSLCVIDRFQQAISRAGHAVADDVMRSASLRLHHSLTSHLIDAQPRLFRFEGNLFCIVIDESETNIQRLQNIIEDMSMPLRVHEQEFYLSLSIGATVLNESTVSLDDLLRRADSALQTVKAAGGHAWRCYDEQLDKHYLRSLQLEDALRQAVNRNEFYLVYQPQIELPTGRVCGVETLLRWQHPELGAISPAEFIPLAESSSLIVPIGEWVLRESMRQASQWRAQGHRFTVAINVSARQWMQADLVALVKHCLAEFRFESGQIELEITESAALADFDLAIRVMTELRGLGVQLSIDDFGTGYSSLSYLHRLPVHKLKIDQSFVRNLAHGNSDASITQIIVMLAHTFNMRVIAEGVESPAQAALLNQWQCDEAQGYLIAKPMRAQALVTWLQEYAPNLVA